jgi:hypothetical protein
MELAVVVGAHAVAVIGGRAVVTAIATNTFLGGGVEGSFLQPALYIIDVVIIPLGEVCAWREEGGVR